MTTNGFVTVTERSGDLRAGAITSTGSDVTLTSPERILDAESGDGLLGSDPTPTDVTGVNIRLTAGTGLTTGGIGTPGNFLEINVGTGVLNAFDRLAATTSGIFLTETIGDMRVDTVWTRGDVTLTTVAGSIVDARNDAEANVFATSIDLDANGAGSSIGDAANDFEIESSHAAAGDVGLEAAANIYVTETRGTLHLVLAEALGGDVRITVRETATATPAPAAAAFTGQVTFNGATLTGSFAASGFLAGTTLRIAGGTPYDGDYTIASVTATDDHAVGDARGRGRRPHGRDAHRRWARSTRTSTWSTTAPCASSRTCCAPSRAAGSRRAAPSCCGSATTSRRPPTARSSRAAASTSTATGPTATRTSGRR